MSSGWSWPLVRLVCTDEYGMRFHPIYHTMRLHRGIDLAASRNDRVYCVAEGRVVWAGYNGGEGNSVHVVHPDGTKTKYFHNTSLAVSVGQVVHEGSLLAYAGTTGDSTGVHVHFETHDNANADSPVNPRGFMAFRGAPFGSAPATGGNSVPASGGSAPIPGDDEEVISAEAQDWFTRLFDDRSLRNLRERPEYKDAMKVLISDAINDEVNTIVRDVNKSLGTITKAIIGDLKNVITRERWQLFSIDGEKKLVAINTATGAYSVYLEGLSDPKLTDDIMKEKVSSYVDPSGKRVPDNPIPFKSELALEAFIEGLKVSDNPADV